MINIGVGAIIFAIWFVILFFGKSIGLSMLLFLIPFSYFFIYILEKNGKINNSKAKFLLIPIFLLSSTYFLFDNHFFNHINLIVIPILFCFHILCLLNEKFEISRNIIRKIAGLFFEPLNYIKESIGKFFEEVNNKLKINAESSKNETIKKVIKSLLITTPIVLIIIILLSTADEIFANVFKEIIEKINFLLTYINLSTVLIKIIYIVIVFSYLIGVFYYICIKYEDYKQINNKIIKKYDDFTIKMILISLNIIYLIFCYIQIKSLFMRNTTLNYAQYARQGFFQLMVVSIINLITILIAKRKENDSSKLINYMCLIMIALTFIIVISAGTRMYFYESAYGYTFFRILVYCILFTESILFIPTIFYILDKNVNLPKVYFIIITVIYICMNFANFDSIIAKRNIDRYIETGNIDMYYLTKEIGSDGIYQMVRIPEISTDDMIKSQASEYLEEMYLSIDSEKMNLMNFNISKLFAKNLISRGLLKNAH